MADSAYGLRDITIDLAIATARNPIRDPAAEGRAIRITGIDIGGVTGGSAGTIILRADSASGPIVFRKYAPATSTIDDTFQFTPPIRCSGLYMDAMSGAWQANSTMVIHTA